MCICVYICVHMCMYMYMCAYVCMLVQMYICARVCPCVYIYMHVYMCMCVRVCMFINIYVCVHMCICVYVCTPCVCGGQETTSSCQLCSSMWVLGIQLKPSDVAASAFTTEPSYWSRPLGFWGNLGSPLAALGAQLLFQSPLIHQDTPEPPGSVLALSLPPFWHTCTHSYTFNCCF